jgi:hypothetical protein
MFCARVISRKQTSDVAQTAIANAVIMLLMTRSRPPGRGMPSHCALQKCLRTANIRRQK